MTLKTTSLLEWRVSRGAWSACWANRPDPQQHADRKDHD
jgi:hypothetical protein